MDEKKPPRPDAVYIPASYAGNSRFQVPIKAYVDEFKPVLGGHPHFHKVGDNDHLAHLNPAKGEPMYFAKTHPRAGEHRFLWEDRGDGVLYGYKVAGADEEEARSLPAAMLREMSEASQAALAAYKAGGERPDTQAREMR